MKISFVVVFVSFLFVFFHQNMIFSLFLHENIRCIPTTCFFFFCWELILVKLNKFKMLCPLLIEVLELVALLKSKLLIKFTFMYIMTNSAAPDQFASEEANWYGSTLFAKVGHIWVQQNQCSGKIFVWIQLLPEAMIIFCAMPFFFFSLVYGSTYIRVHQQRFKYSLQFTVPWCFTKPQCQSICEEQNCRSIYYSTYYQLYKIWQGMPLTMPPCWSKLSNVNYFNRHCAWIIINTDFMPNWQSAVHSPMLVGLEFNSPVSTIKVIAGQSVYLTTLFLGRLSPLGS